MVASYDQGKRALEELIGWAEANDFLNKRNEATTRLHLIDSMLTEVLTWPKELIQAEEPAGSGRIDYALGKPATQLIIEAKREGEYFELPPGTQTGVHSISSITDGNASKALRNAMIQVAGYAASNGVPLAGVTNGHQLVLFIAVRTDGTPPLGGSALVFPTLSDMLSDFRLLWDHASPPGVDQRALFAKLRGVAARAPEPLSTHLTDYPGVKKRNDLQMDLEILGELFLIDVARLHELRTEFLVDCYASSGALSQYAEVSKQILQTRYSLLSEQPGIEATPVQDKKGLRTELTQDMLAAAASHRPIILLGDVGVGKTTFIQRLVHVDASDLFENAITLYIDFGSSTTLGDLREFVLRESGRQLLEQYGIDIEESAFVEAVYHGDLNRFDKSVAGMLKEIDPTAYLKRRIQFLEQRISERSEHLPSCLTHLRSTQQRQVVIFLDNIDQRSATDQDQVFLIANEIASSWPATVFVTLRPETFHTSSHSGALSGYQARVFTISPPRTEVMLQKRFDFVLKRLRDSGEMGSLPVGITLGSSSLEAFLKMLAENCKSNRELIALIDNIAGGNMRLALDFVTQFIGSGHVDSRKILEIFEQSGHYKIPIHEFLRALLYGDGVHYDPESSPIANILRISQPDGREHFLLPLLLAEIQSQGDKLAREGYVGADAVYAFAQNLGFNEQQIVAALEHAVAKRLVHQAPRLVDARTHIHYRITTVGAYTTRLLMRLFAYADAMVVDTPIIDVRYRTVISDAFSLSERLARAEYFRTYLDKQWENVGATGAAWDWSVVSDALGKDIREIGKRTDPDTWNYL